MATLIDNNAADEKSGKPRCKLFIIRCTSISFTIIDDNIMILHFFKQIIILNFIFVKFLIIIYNYHATMLYFTYICIKVDTYIH